MSTHPTPTTEQAIAAMQQYGGSFVRALAAAWLAADPTNRALIEKTWSADIERYRREVA